MTECGRFLGQIKKIADHDVNENTQIVGIEVLVGGASGEKEIQKFEDEELKRGFAYKARSVQRSMRRYSTERGINVLSRFRRSMRFSPKVLKAGP